MGRPPKHLAGLYDEVTTSFWEGTVFTRDSPAPRLAPCWFREHMGAAAGPCEGPIQGCHFIKRQRVEAAVGYACSGLRWQALSDEELPTLEEIGALARELPLLAAWDPRNGIPGCEAHHQRFDSQRMPSLCVPRLLVPDHVEEFCTDWGLETALEDRCRS